VWGFHHPKIPSLAPSEGVPYSLNPPWPPPRITEPGSATGDSDYVFSNKSLIKVYWYHFAYCHSRFQRRYIDVECENLVSGLVQEKYGQLAAAVRVDHGAC